VRIEPAAALPDWLEPVADLADTVRPEQMAPLLWDPPSNARPAAVLVCFADGDDGPELLLTERSNRLRSHAGQISFPGGSSDPDDDGPVGTALREANEEVGLDPATVTVFGTLPPRWLVPSNFSVTPVLAYWQEPHELERSDGEVYRILHEPLDRLLDPANRFTLLHPSGWRGPAFEIGTAVPLWGFTAGVISMLFRLVGWDKPWDDSVTRRHPEVR
jgi:8-oxo-dGTP pyrophosphatase MutT (NUDIX family)